MVMVLGAGCWVLLRAVELYGIIWQWHASHRARLHGSKQLPKPPFSDCNPSSLLLVTCWHKGCNVVAVL